MNVILLSVLLPKVTAAIVFGISWFEIVSRNREVNRIVRV
jgi:hypothetical protein